MEQQQVVQRHSKFGIGIEREIYSKPYFSYHYGYRNLSQIPTRSSKSKLYFIENLVKEKFEDINFQILFLNISSKGTFVNFVLKDRQNFDRLGIVPVRETNSFTVPLDIIGRQDVPHREIFPKANLNEFDIESSTLKVANKTISQFSPIFYCIGFDGHNSQLNYNDMHLELYPEKNIVGLEDFINTLEKYDVNTKPFVKYFLDYKKFSHIKIRITNGEIKNIKYYRAINVKIPQFYYE